MLLLLWAGIKNNFHYNPLLQSPQLQLCGKYQDSLGHKRYYSTINTKKKKNKLINDNFKYELYYPNMEEAKDLIYKDLNHKKGVYLLYNNIDDIFYVGSSINLYKRLIYYYFNSRLQDNRYITRSGLRPNLPP